MRSIVILFVGIALILLVAFSIFRNHESLPPDVQPAEKVRAAVKGKSADAVSKIIVNIAINEQVVVIKKQDIEAFLRGMKSAIETKDKALFSGPSITIVWKDGSKSGPFWFDNMGDPKYAYGKTFAEAFNRVVEPDRRIKIK